MSIQLVFAAMAAIAALIVVMALMSNNRQPTEELHMDSYNPEAAGKKGGFVEGFLESFNKSLTRNKGGRSSRLTDELAKADLKLRVSEYVMVIVGLIVLLCAILFLRFHSPILALIGIPVGYFAPGFFLKFRQRRRLQPGRRADALPTSPLALALRHPGSAQRARPRPTGSSPLLLA